MLKNPGNFLQKKVLANKTFLSLWFCLGFVFGFSCYDGLYGLLGRSSARLVDANCGTAPMQSATLLSAPNLINKEQPPGALPLTNET